MNLRYPSTPIPSKWAALFYAAYFGVLGVVLPFLGPYLRARGVAVVGIGLVTAAFSLAKLVYAPAVGAMVDRGVWFRGLLLLHMAVSVLCALAVDHVAGAWQIGVAFFLIGVGYGTVLPLVEAAILERLPRPGYGLLRLWGSAGFVAAAAVAALLLTGDRLAGFPLLLAGVLSALALGCLPFETAARPRHDRRPGRLSPVVWWLLVLLTLHQVAHGPYYAFFSIHLREKGFSTAAVSVLWSLGVAAELVAFLGGRRLESLFGLRRLLGVALLLTPLRWLLLSLPPTWGTLAAAQAGHAVTFAVVHLAGVQLVQQNVPSGVVRHAQALYSGLSFGLGVVLGSALAGPVFAEWGGAGSFLVAAAFSALLFVAWLPLSRRLSEDPEGLADQKIT